MVLHYEQVGVNDNGTPQFTIMSDQDNPIILMTGEHVDGEVQLPDGAKYDITPPFIELDAAEHIGHLGHVIGVMRERHGCGPESREDPFIHECTDECGPAKRS